MNNPMNPSKAPVAERRRYARYPIALDALMTIQGPLALSCEIRDFCHDGMYLKVREGEEKLKLLTAQLHKRAEIQFTIPLDGNARQFNLNAQIVRISHEGVGVAFDEPPLVALRALRRRSDASKHFHSSSIYRLKDKFNIVQSCSQALDRCAISVANDFFQKIAHDLTVSADHAESNQTQSSYLDARLALQHEQKAIEPLFQKAVRDRLYRFFEPNTQARGKLSQELSLIDKDAFEDWLNLSEVIGKTEAAFEHELRELEAKFNTLTAPAVNNENNPFAPASICQAFSASIEGLPLNLKVRQVLYTTLAAALKAPLDQLYLQLKEILAPVQPTIRAPAKPPQAPSESAESAESSSEAPRDFKPQAPPHGAHQSAPSSAPGSQQAGFNLPKAINALSSLHHLAQAISPAAGGSPSFAQGESAAPHANNVVIADNLFVAMLQDTGLSGSLKPYLQKLKWPLLKLAAKDSAFLNSASHPARQVINLLDQCAVADKGSTLEPHLQKLLSDLSERIAREFDSDSAVFSKVKDKLERIDEQLQRTRALNTARVLEYYEGRQKIERAKYRAEQEIHRRIAGKKVPKVLLALLEAGWQRLMALSELRYGPENESWRCQLEAIERLLGWLCQENVEGNLAERRALLDFIDEALAPVCLNRLQQESILQELTACLVGSKKPELVWVDELKPQQLGAEVLPEEERPWLEDVKQLRPGDWLLYSEGGKKVPVRLTWIGENPDCYVFVNRRGIKKLALSPWELAQKLRDGLAEKIDDLDLPLMERATDAALQTMYRQIVKQATCDQITGLMNRKEFLSRLKREFYRLKHNHAEHMLCFLEIDQFRMVNSSCGHEAGDALLKEIAALIQVRLKPQEMLARIGDDTFGLILQHCAADKGCLMAEKLCAAIKQYHFKWEDKSYSLGVNIGLAPFSEHTESVAQLVKRADAACLAAKETGLHGVQLYEEHNARLKFQEEVMKWAGYIDHILAEERLFLRCQLIKPMRQEGVQESHYEILLGVLDEQGRPLPPDKFVPAAERCKRMPDVDRYIIQRAFRWIAENRAKFDPLGGFSINLSGQSINNDEFLQSIKEQLASTSIPLHKITFEITETAAIDNFMQAEKFIRQVRRYGCKFSLDDFGSGSSSYAYLKNLKVDYLKIDGIFVKDLAGNQADYAMVKSMHEIGHSLGMKTIAEYVENDEILAKLKAIGVDYAQGYGIEKPILLTDLK